MGASTIEWTDETWNPVRGCTKISPGCKFCYASTFAERWRGVKGHPYEQGFDLRIVPEKLSEPLNWRKPRRVFVNSMSDLFQVGVPDEYVAKVFGVMRAAPKHTFQVLTKRPDRMQAFLKRCANWGGWITHDGTAPAGAYDGSGIVVGDADRWPLPNVWLGVSVENQEYAEERIPVLLQTPAAVRFISAEPLLGPVDLAAASPNPRSLVEDLDWVIVGGESGPGARPFNIQWARDLVAQCSVAGVPCFVKQLGAVPVMHEVAWRAASPTPVLNSANEGRAPACTVPLKLGSKKGGDPLEWPEDLRVREFPEVRTRGGK